MQLRFYLVGAAALVRAEHDRVLVVTAELTDASSKLRVVPQQLDVHAAAVVRGLELDLVLDHKRLALDRLDNLREHRGDRCPEERVSVCEVTHTSTRLWAGAPDRDSLRFYARPWAGRWVGAPCFFASSFTSRPMSPTWTPLLPSERPHRPWKSALLEMVQTLSNDAWSSKFSKNSVAPSGCGRRAQSTGWSEQGVSYARPAEAGGRRAGRG